MGLFLGLGPAAHAQTATTLPGVPAGQGGPDNQVNSSQGGNAPGGQNNPAVNAGPATSTDEGSSLAPWLVGAALLVVLALGGALIARKVAAGSDSGYDRRTA
ncbi:MAG: hypothetical protein ACR2KK_11990 [Acidimicrobiales bacterium]